MEPDGSPAEPGPGELPRGVYRLALFDTVVGGLLFCLWTWGFVFMVLGHPHDHGPARLDWHAVGNIVGLVLVLVTPAATLLAGACPFCCWPRALRLATIAQGLAGYGYAVLAILFQYEHQREGLGLHPFALVFAGMSLVSFLGARYLRSCSCPPGVPPQSQRGAPTP
ncbi:MAG: hypothetical protein HY320_00300 [Armatimonadetes bacterium]|nr:hypothetical protein [Armatimonadota bacterium]